MGILGDKKVDKTNGTHDQTHRTSKPLIKKKEEGKILHVMIYVLNRGHPPSLSPILEVMVDYTSASLDIFARL